MYRFKNDYSEGAHESILEALTHNNRLQSDGYGLDDHCKEAIALILKAVGQPQAAVHFLEGGTQANLTALTAFLRPHEAVIAADTGHIYVHETGAIEATGHKVFPLSCPDGKLTPAQVESVVAAHTDEHMVKPRLVYLSNPTEIGTIYKKQELQAMRACCDRHNLLLYIDGARLGCALTSTENDLTLADLGNLCDAFYIGGTKNGALFGEALVIVNPALQGDFRYFIKQRGGMLAKGWLLGLQFKALFTDNLYYSLAQHANEMACVLKEGITDCGYPFLVDSPTNQLFPILPDHVVMALAKDYGFMVWSKHDESHTVIRLVTSWATPKTAVEAFVASLKACQ